MNRRHTFSVGPTIYIYFRKGISQSALPYRRSVPTWLKLTPEDCKELIYKLAKKGHTPSQIGVILRDSHGVAQVRFRTGNKILRIVKSMGLAPDLPEDLYYLIKKAVAVRKHLERNRKDKDSKFRLILVESRIHRLARYYKAKGSLPPNWKYESSTASALGISQSALPYRRSVPTWLKLTPEDCKELIYKLAKKGHTPSQIGVILRDSHGVAQVRFRTGNKILRIVKSMGLAPDLPEDLYYLIKKAVAVRKHLERNRKDKDSKFRLILVESRIHRLARYYKAKGSLPPNWKYESSTASALVA
ncbi:RS13 protein, partial [Pseudoatta argentina]